MTLLDAHPDLAMSYELYPNLLETHDGSPDALLALADRVDAARDIVRAGKSIDERGLSTYVLRCARSGLDHHQLALLLRQHAHDDDLTTAQGRLRFMERCCLAKMASEGKRRWGLKCTSRFEEYLELWPQASFINMVRDGRDVLASQQNTGAFTNTPADLGRSWASLHLRFRELVDDPAVNALEVCYERLVRDPAGEARRIAQFIGVGFDERMLDFHRADLTIFTSSHLSMERISKPIDDSMVGRWREDLSAESLEEFYAEAGSAMQVLGYDVEGLPAAPLPPLLRDFFASMDLASAHLAEIAPANHAFSTYALESGARRVVVFGGDASLADDGPTDVETRPLADAGAAGLASTAFDGVFSIGNLNALAADTTHGARDQVADLVQLVRPFGWCWVAPSNVAPAEPALDTQQIEQALAAQAEAFEQHGFVGFDLSPELAASYGLPRRETGCPIFVRNLRIPDDVARCMRLTDAQQGDRPPTRAFARELISQPAPPADQGELDQGGAFPLDFYLGFLDFLARHRDRVQVITYADLPWGGDLDFQAGYPQERLAWERWLAEEPERQQKAYLLLQHDVDSQPQRSLAVARESADRGLPANLMIFNRRVHRRQLRDTGVLGFTDYPLDSELLQRLEREHGFVIGYHSNAMEQALWNEAAALGRFREDISDLRTRHDVRFFSPHGGVRGPFSANNSSLLPPADLASDVRWVANRFSPRFAASYSDGGLNNLTRLARKDLRAFVRAWQPGRRYRVLTHPQYYVHDAQPRERLLSAEWYADLFETAHGGARALWDDVELDLVARGRRSAPLDRSRLR